jgi:hypothetical protein
MYRKLTRKAESSIDNIRVQRKQCLSNLVGTRVLAVQRRHKSSLLAVVVELVVHAALGENCALKLVQVPRDLWILTRLNKAVFKHEAELEVLTLNEREKFGGARVHVRRVDTAGVEEADGGGYTQASENGEILDGGSDGDAAFAAVDGQGGRVEGEHDLLPQIHAGDELLCSVDEEALEALHSRRGSEQIVEEGIWGRGRGWYEGGGDGAWLPDLGLGTGLDGSDCESGDDDFVDGEHVDGDY